MANNCIICLVCRIINFEIKFMFPFSNTFWLELEKLAWPFTVVSAGMMLQRWPLDIHWYVVLDNEIK